MVYVYSPIMVYAVLIRTASSKVRVGALIPRLFERGMIYRVEVDLGLSL